MRITLLTRALRPTAEVLPALGLLPHDVTVLRPEAATSAERQRSDVIMIDARQDLVEARALSKMLARVGLDVPVIGVLTEGGMIALSADWVVNDVVLDTVGPAELDARLRRVMELRVGREAQAHADIRVGDLSIDESTYTAHVSQHALDLTFREFELLRFLAQHPGRVFSRAHLLQEVWCYDYFGDTRTVDVHVRRLRAKLGAEHESIIATVRNVGYKFVRPEDDQESDVVGSRAGSTQHRDSASAP